MQLFLDDRVFIQGAAATPVPLIHAMAEHGKSAGLTNVEVVHIHLDGQAEYALKEYAGSSLYVYACLNNWYYPIDTCCLHVQYRSVIQYIRLLLLKLKRA